MVCTRRKGTDKIDDPKKCDVTFSKRSDGLMKKADALDSLTGTLFAVTVVSSKGEVRSFSKPSVEEGDMKLQIILKEWLDWAKKVCDSCMTKEDCASSIMKYQVLLNCLCKKVKDLQLKDCAGDDSLEKNFETPHPSFVAGVEHDIFLTSPVDSAATSSESLGMDSNPMCFDIEEIGWLLDHLTELANDPDIRTLLLEESSCSDREGYEKNANVIDCSDSASSSGASLGVDPNPTCSDLKTVEWLLTDPTELANDNDIQTLLRKSGAEGNENNADNGIFAERQSLGVSL